MSPKRCAEEKLSCQWSTSAYKEATYIIHCTRCIIIQSAVDPYWLSQGSHILMYKSEHSSGFRSSICI